MIRFAVLALCSAACGRSQGVPDQELPGLVTEARKAEAPVDVELATKDPAELGRVLAQPYRLTVQALGPHSLAINTSNVVEEAGKRVSELSDHTRIDSGAASAYQAVYSNSADHGRETTFAGGKLYLRPRYQRWHGRAPESPDEPAALRDEYASAVAATWELLAPGAELIDRGAIQVAGRTGRKIEVRRASAPRKPPAEPLAQRTWREGRSVDAVAGEIVLDAAKGVPLAVKLSGTVGFSRDGRRFSMKLSVDSVISGIGTATAIVAPVAGEVVATPERLREVDDRDYLLQGIAPPLRRTPDGTAVPPSPRIAPPPAQPAPPSAAAKPAAAAPRAGDAAGKPTDGGKP